MEQTLSYGVSDSNLQQRRGLIDRELHTLPPVKQDCNVLSAKHAKNIQENNHLVAIKHIFKIRDD
jgi:hypothetical protein